MSDTREAVAAAIWAERRCGDQNDGPYPVDYALADAAISAYEAHPPEWLIELVQAVHVISRFAIDSDARDVARKSLLSVPQSVYEVGS